MSNQSDNGHEEQERPFIRIFHSNVAQDEYVSEIREHEREMQHQFTQYRATVEAHTTALQSTVECLAALFEKSLQTMGAHPSPTPPLQPPPLNQPQNEPASEAAIHGADAAGARND